MTEGPVFVTGGQRSGTTLLAKLLGILSQPFPFLFTEVKGAFLRTLGSEDRYPLGHLFLEKRYSAEEFARFLREWRTNHAELRALFARMKTYSGQYSRFADERLEDGFARIPDDADFAEVVASLDRALTDDAGAAYVGSKETICEEYVPALLDRGFRCVIILRDPRDMVASLNHGRGGEFAGTPKPTLFNIRSWRKSVAFALAMEWHPRFRWCRYEDLVARPDAELERLGFDAAADVRDWRGNSSHGEMQGISAASIGAYRNVLDPAVAESIEAACLPELQCLGYETSLSHAAATEVLDRFTEHYTITRTGMEADAATPANAVLEAQRLELVSRKPGEESARWFLFEKAHARLREAFRA